MSARKAKSASVKLPVCRLSNWPTLLAKFIESRRGAAFKWGENDCCLFVCDGIQTITGLDPAAKMFRGKYRDALGAARLLKRHGGVETVAEKQCARLGWPECPVPLAGRGDVVLYDVDAECHPVAMNSTGTPSHQVIGICLGHLVAAVSPAGLVFLPVGQCRRAWRVG